jgi:hypothetical protein
MSVNFIHVTRWVNSHKEFVDVGMLCESDDLEKAFPTVSFNYTDGYLDKYAPLYPKQLLRTDSSALINHADYNATLPKAFTPYLPNQTIKEVLSIMLDGFEDMTPFQQLKAVSDIKGDFGSVQLNYNNETQFNSLPQTVAEVSRLLDVMRSKSYADLKISDVNAIYEYDTHNPAIRMVRWADNEKYHIATVTQVNSLSKAKELAVLQGVMQASGINVFDVNIEKHDDKYFVIQNDPHVSISKNSIETVVEDSMHIQPLLRTTKYISDESKLCAAEVSNLCKSIAGTSAAKEMYARSVVAQVLNQRDFNINQVKFNEVSGVLKLSPQQVNPIVENNNSPFQLPLVSGQSNQIRYSFSENGSPSLARAFGITSRQQEKILDKINDAFSSVVEIANEKGISSEYAFPIRKIHESSGLFKVTVPQSQGDMPDLEQ